MRAVEPPPRIVVLPGVGHFFHGRLTELRDAVLAPA
jgi:alpha/beta superfamily hydrolase